MLFPEFTQEHMASAISISNRLLVALARGISTCSNRTSSLSRSPINKYSQRRIGVDPVWWTVCRLGRLRLLEHLCLVSDWG